MLNLHEFKFRSDHCDLSPEPETELNFSDFQSDSDSECVPPTAKVPRVAMADVTSSLEGNVYIMKIQLLQILPAHICTQVSTNLDAIVSDLLFWESA